MSTNKSKSYSILMPHQITIRLYLQTCYNPTIPIAVQHNLLFFQKCIGKVINNFQK